MTQRFDEQVSQQSDDFHTEVCCDRAAGDSQSQVTGGWEGVEFTVCELTIMSGGGIGKHVSKGPVHLD